MLRPTVVRLAALLAIVVSIGLAGCGGNNPAGGGDGAAAAVDSSGGESGSRDTDAAAEDEVEIEIEIVGACALTTDEMSGILLADVTESSAEGEWGEESTCTYAIAGLPEAVVLSSATSVDLTAERAFDRTVDVLGLGDDAVWVPANSTLTVVDKTLKKLLRIHIGMSGSDTERLTLARKIAALCLPKL